MNYLISIATLFCLFSTPVFAQSITPPYNLVLFALMGQSNMSGKGNIADAPYLAQEQTDIYTFGNDWFWHNAKEPVDSSLNQVNVISSDANAGVGPSLAFAIAYRDSHPGTAVGLIPCAKGASSIKTWDRNSAISRLYGSCLARINEAMQYGTLGGLLWFQGEQDAQDPAVVANISPFTWALKFTQFVSFMRIDFSMPYLPVVFAQLGPVLGTAHPYWDLLKSEQASIHMSRVGMIKTDDLQLEIRSPVHFNTASYIQIGQRFSDAMTKVESQPIGCVCGTNN